MKFKIRKKQRNIIIAAVILTAVIIAVCVRSGVFKPKYTYSGDPYVCLDAGHGAYDVGAANGDRYEKDDDLKLTLKIKEKLEAMGTLCCPPCFKQWASRFISPVTMTRTLRLMNAANRQIKSTARSLSAFTEIPPRTKRLTESKRGFQGIPKVTNTRSPKILSVISAT